MAKTYEQSERLAPQKHAVLIEAVRTELGDSAEILGKNSGLHILLRILFKASEKS
ncbi:hypothetical protein MOD11_09160 [Bacillus atrophaeus]|nr:hypothetical protein [Bacillus atrophaeus]MCY8526356.1 hypothetical protein [Bacillus atrophaeus]